MRWILKAYAQAMALAFCGTMASSAMAASNCTWNPATGNWSTASDWSCGIVPSGPASDIANIGAGKVVTINDTRSIFTLNNSGGVNIDAFLLTLQGGGSTTNTGIINVGAGPIPNNAALQVSGGHNINNTGGVINISPDSVLNQFGSTITGGTINTTGTGALAAFNSGNNFLNGVTLNGLLDISTATGIERISAGGLTLNGTVNIGNNSNLAPQGNQTIGGSGNIIFADGSANNRLNVEAGNLTLDSGITVRGQTGIIGQQAFVGGAASLTNNGTIAADVAGGTISLGVNGTVTNNGTLTALNGGTLVLNNSIQGNVGSQITVGAGSTILQNGVTLNGVIDNSTGTGSFRASNSGNNFLNAASFTGVLDLASATGIERVTGGLTLNGTVNIGNNSNLAPQGDQTIGGSGNIVFADGSANNRLNVEAGNLTLDSGITVRGNTGIIGQQAFIGGAASLTNNGTIAADVAGGTISLGVNGTVTNNGTLTALNGGTLVLNNSIQGNVGSQITVGAGSTILQNGVTLNGVIDNSTGTGSFRASNSGNNFLSAASFTGVLDLASATGIERVAGGLTLNGTVNIGNNSNLAPQGNQTIGGSGNIVFADGSANNRLNVEAGNLTLGSGITVRGNTGIIGQQAFVGGAATLTNNGTIAADVAGGTISLGVNGLTTNNGTLAALNGGTLNLNSAVVGATGSQIVAGAGSVVNQNGVTISGDMNLTGAGSFRASNSGNNVLSGVTLSGTLDLASATGIEKVAGGLTLSGATINISNNSILAPQGNQTISGSGNIVFADGSANNRLNVEAGNLTLDSGITVRGGNGIIGQQAFVGGAATLTNQGLISADVNGRRITVDINGSLINQGTMQAQNGGQLTLNNMSGGVNNSAGTLLADLGSTVLFNGTTVTGGTLNSNGSGVFKAANSNSNFLNGVTLNGVLDMASAGGTERISDGGMTLNGTINIGNNSTLAPQGNQTIAGNGSIVFADGNANNRLNVEAGNLVIGSGVTVRGQTGVIGQQAFVGGAATLTNNGTINADAGGTITVNVNGALTNNGTMRAQNGTLLIQDALGGTGTLQVDPTGVMNLANSPNTQGKLIMGATGSTLNIGTQNLTITNDYTNAAAGTGNSFNRRAGVSGTGQILAGSDAAQAITGDGVTNGNTANATLTLGNVRVGATTFDYQVANTGATGPSLRGAIQTNVNGANLTDARLSGTGVTADNYNTGAPGNNTGNLGVTFTAANAGALAPLAGQVLNLRSNFDNIADQKLNIVLGAGAAAFNAAAGDTDTPVQIANQRTGGDNSTALTVANTAAAGAFSEDLNASFGANTGAVSNNGDSINGRLAGTNNTGSGAMTAAVDTTSAGAKTGSVTLNYQTAGAVNGVSNGLGIAGAGSQAVTVSGNVYQLAAGMINTTPLNFGTVQVGQSVSQALSISNVATGPTGFIEDMNANFGASNGTGAGLISGSGTFTGLAAGGTNNGSLVVNVNTGSAGVVNGDIVVNFFSNGTVDGVSNGLGVLGVGSTNYGVSGAIQANGNIVDAANPVVNNPVINLGNMRINSAEPSAAVSVTNLASGNQQAALNASISGNAPITAVGSFNLLNPGVTDNTSLLVGMNTTAAGAINGTATIAFVSDASNIGNCAPNCQMNLASQDVNVSGAVYRLANPVLNTGNVTLAARVGDSAPTAGISISNSSPDGFTEGLKASAGVAPAGFNASGAIGNLAAGGTDASSIQVALNTGTAGNFGGTLTTNFTSTGAGTTGAADISIGSADTNLTGKVYQAAAASVTNAPINFGIVHVGDVLGTQALTVNNIAPVVALNDTLKGNFGGAIGPFTTGGNFTNLGAGGTDNSSLFAGLNTSTAGIFNGSATAGFASSNTDMADLALPDVVVNLMGQVNNYANPDFDLVSGAGSLTGGGLSFNLDFGNVFDDTGIIDLFLSMDNDVVGPADLIDGNYVADTNGINDFTFTGFNNFADLAAGMAQSGLKIGFDTDALGLGQFTDAVLMNVSTHNASGYKKDFQVTLNLKGQIIAYNGNVPEPESLLLMGIGLSGLLVARRRGMMAQH